MTVFYSVLVLLGFCVILGKIQDIRERKTMRQTEQEDGYSPRQAVCEKVLFRQEKKKACEEVKLMRQQETYYYLALRTVADKHEEHHGLVAETFLHEGTVDEPGLLKRIAQTHDNMRLLIGKYLAP